ncbi:MAG: hypothetical protein Ct9H300mP26_1760 [Acidimicrobiales bacterium]|nr:MAG: hypothetical protein Ct9H300mP26_1760 [Acidimicrobiales bacterium]
MTQDNESVTLEARGRHDPCVLPRAVPNGGGNGVSGVGGPVIASAGPTRSVNAIGYLVVSFFPARIL